MMAGDKNKPRLGEHLGKKAEEKLKDKSIDAHKDTGAELRKVATKRTNLQRGGAASQKKSAAGRTAEEGKGKK